MENKNNFRVLIADEDSAGSRRFIDFLSEKGFSAHHVMKGSEVKEVVQSWKPHFLIYDLILPELNAPQLLTWLKDPSLAENQPKVIVTSSNSIVKNIKECIKLGAVDYIVRPYKLENILNRLIFHIQNKREIASDAKSQMVLDGGDLYLQLLDVVMREALSDRETEDVLFNISKMIAISLKAVRCSVVKISEDRLTGTILASSDEKDESVRGMVLDMNKYPEMIHVMNTEKSIVIEDLEYDPQLAKIKDLVKGISFNSMILCPLVRNGEMYGVISARMDKKHSKFNERDIRFTQLTAQVISLHLAKGGFMPHEFFMNPQLEVPEALDSAPAKKVS